MNLFANWRALFCYTSSLVSLICLISYVLDFTKVMKNAYAHTFIHSRIFLKFWSQIVYHVWFWKLNIWYRFDSQNWNSWYKFRIRFSGDFFCWYLHTWKFLKWNTRVSDIYCHKAGVGRADTQPGVSMMFLLFVLCRPCEDSPQPGLGGV